MMSGFTLRHLLMQGCVQTGCITLPAGGCPRRRSLSRARRRFMLHAQVEAGTLCPITMTFAATPLLQQALPKPFSDWLSLY